MIYLLRNASLYGIELPLVVQTFLLYYLSPMECPICDCKTELSLEMLSIHCILIMNVHFHNDASFCAEKKKKKKRNQTVPKDDDDDAIERDHSTKLSLKTTPTAEGLYNYEVPVP